MIQVEQGSWSIPIAPQGAVEHTFASRKLDVNVAYRIDIGALTFPAKRGQEHLGQNAERVAKFAVTVIEPGFEGIEREINMGLPKPIPQGADEKGMRGILFSHERWFNVLLSIGYQDQQARQIVQQGGVTPAVLANAPGRGQAYMYVEEDEYEAVVLDPTTKQPRLDVTTGQPMKETRKGENRDFCSPNVYQKNSASAARSKNGGQQGQQASAPPAFNPGNGAPAGMVAGQSHGGQPSFTAPPAGGGFAPAPNGNSSPFVAPGGGFPGGSGGAPLSGPMGALTTPRQ